MPPPCCGVRCLSGWSREIWNPGGQDREGQSEPGRKAISDRRRLCTRQQRRFGIGGDFVHVNNGDSGSAEALYTSTKAMSDRRRSSARYGSQCRVDGGFVCVNKGNVGPTEASPSFPSCTWERPGLTKLHFVFSACAASGGQASSSACTVVERAATPETSGSDSFYLPLIAGIVGRILVSP